jgi:hypothetical protein
MGYKTRKIIIGADMRNTLNKILTTAFLTLFVVSAFGSRGSNDSLRYEILMSSRLLNDLKINTTLTGSFDITSKELILLSSDKQFYLLGWGEFARFGKTSEPYIESFAFTPDSLLMVIRNNELCYMDSTGNLSGMFKLPGQRMGITAGKNVMYLYDRNVAKDKNALYILASGGKYVKLFEVPKPIYSVVEYGNFLFFATENAVFQFNLNSKELKAVAALAGNQYIKSVTVDPTAGNIYFSTDDMICSLKDNSVFIITDKLGGTLRYFKGLIVYNNRSKLMMRIVGLEKAIVTNPLPVDPSPDSNQQIEVLDNSTIIDLVDSGLSEELIINIIRNARVNFNLSIDEMVRLSEQNVPSAVILAMKQAMEK